MGRYGLYYRQYLGQHQRNATPSPATPVLPTEPAIIGTIIPTADVTQLRDSSADELLSYIREQHAKAVTAPWISALAGLLLVGMIAREVALWLVACCIVLIIAAHLVVSRFDAGRKRVVLGYHLDESARSKYDSLLDAMKSLASAQRLWRIITSDPSLDTKYTAGATDLISRKGATVQTGAPAHIETNVPVWKIALGTQSLYFFPDRLLVYQGSQIGAVPYPELNANSFPTRFVESDGVPGDARVVGTTWRYTNKGGGPDRRFANNPSIPVAEYAQMVLHSKAGLNFVLHCSSVLAAQTFVSGLSGYCSTAMTAHVAESSNATPPDTPEPSLTPSALEGWGWTAAPALLTLMFLALVVGPRGSYLPASPPAKPSTSQAQQPLPKVRILRQKGTQVLMAVPSGTSDSDLRRLLDDLRIKIESSQLSELGIRTAKQGLSTSAGTIFIFRTDGTQIPALAQSDAALKWSPKETTATLRQADGTRVPAFGSAQ
jgi:hypothetical protein